MGADKTRVRDREQAGWTERIGAVVGVIGLLTTAFGTWLLVQDHRREQTADVEAARDAIVADTLQMASYDAESGANAEGEIELLGADAARLIDEYPDDELDLTATNFRLIAQYLTWSTSDLTLAEAMLDKADRVADDQPLERVLVARLRADLAAQEQSPGELEKARTRALALTQGLDDPPPSIDDFTIVYGLIDAYLGAQRSTSDTTRQAFCDLAVRWHDDAFPRLTARQGSAKVRRQLGRVGADGAADLESVCTPR